MLLEHLMKMYMRYGRRPAVVISDIDATVPAFLGES
jgi:hypothetical protein